jgi:hypothetical protein
MSEKESAIVHCIHCGSKHRITAYPVLDKAESPRLARRLINGTFFEHKCNTCGKIYEILYPVLYKDDENAVMICYSTDTNEEVETNIAIQRRRDGMESEAEDPIQIRHVRSCNALREKARLFEVGLDDRIIELLKVQLLNRGKRQQAFSESIHEVLCWAGDDARLYFDFLGDADTISTGIDVGLYHLLYKYYNATINNQHPNPSMVDIDWAMNFITSNNFPLFL